MDRRAVFEDEDGVDGRSEETGDDEPRTCMDAGAGEGERLLCSGVEGPTRRDAADGSVLIGTVELLALWGPRVETWNQALHL